MAKIPNMVCGFPLKSVFSLYLFSVIFPEFAMFYKIVRAIKTHLFQGKARRYRFLVLRNLDFSNIFVSTLRGHISETAGFRELLLAPICAAIHGLSSKV